MSDIPKAYVKELLQKQGIKYISKDAINFFIKEVNNFSENLAKNSNDCLKVRKGKKIMEKDVELASKYTK